MRKQYGKVVSAAVWAAGLLMAGRAMAGRLDPTNAPGPTMHTLEEIYQKVGAFVSPQTLSATTTVVNAGYYATTNLTQVDTDLKAENIATNVTIFGIAGTLSTNTGGSSLFNGCWVTIEIALPSDYRAPRPTSETLTNEGGWWKIRYNMGSGGGFSTDLTTWQVELRGNPVHLVQE
jgi:hypothetical protein